MADGHPGVRVTGALAPWASGFATALAAQGYTEHAVARQVNLMAQLSRWLAWHGLAAAELTPPVVERFAVAMRDLRRHLVSPRALRPLLGYLRDRDVVPAAVAVDDTPRGRLLSAYRSYLAGERGLAAGTVCRHQKIAAAFLAEVGEPLASTLSGLSGRKVLGIVSGWMVPPVGVPTAQIVAGSIRTLLGFLFVTGRIGRELASVVPSVARWRLASVPGRLDGAAVTAMLASCDRDIETGRRDHAIILLVARLGLRPGDVAALVLQDVDWAAGVITVHGKGGRDDRLPLPHEVGVAGAACLRSRQPGDRLRALFLSAGAPRRPLSRSGAGQVIVQAGRRVGLPCGPRLLRQTLASDLLAAGAPLAEIAQVLRHQDIRTTTLYTKIDDRALALLVRPWPGQLPGGQR